MRPSGELQRRIRSFLAGTFETTETFLIEYSESDFDIGVLEGVRKRSTIISKILMAMPEESLHVVASCAVTCADTSGSDMVPAQISAASQFASNDSRQLVVKLLFAVIYKLQISNGVTGLAVFRTNILHQGKSLDI
jgi:hypothetical protein